VADHSLTNAQSPVYLKYQQKAEHHPSRIPNTVARLY
jgi:hypothetical protein